MKKGKKRLITGFSVFLLFILAFAIFSYKHVKTVQVSGISMLPTLHDGDRVLVTSAYWLFGTPKTKDIVVIKDSGPTGYIIKRIQYTSGESVPAEWAPDDWAVTKGPYKVPEGEFYVLGDNRPNSEDSRKFGAVEPSEIIGKVLVSR
jgi:signal peptidase I